MITDEITAGNAADQQMDITMDGILTPDMDEGKAKRQLVQSPQDDHLAKDEMCGCLILGYPRWLQSFASLKVFMVALCLVVFLDALELSLFEGTLTTMEVRYQLSASQFGLVTSLFTIGSVVSTIVVTHFGGRPTSRRPVWIGACVTLNAIGSFVPTLPQFIFSSYQPQISFISSNGPNTSESLDGRCLLNAVYGEEETGVCQSEDHQILYENNIAFIILLIGNLIVGLGYGPLVPLSLAYVADNGSTETAGLLSGLLEGMYGLGAIIGFQVAAATLNIWVDFYRVDVANTFGLTPDDQGWVGAWWIGFLILAVLYVASMMPVCGFPKRIHSNLKDTNSNTPSSAEKNDSEDKVEQKETSTLTDDLKEWPRTVWRLCKSPVFTLASFSLVCENAVTYSTILFFPKYLQQQFGIDIYTANTIAGFAAVPAWSFGALAGGLVVKIKSLKMRGSVAMCVFGSFIGCGFCIAQIFVGCDNQPIAGVTVGYQRSNLNGVGLEAACNSDCLCPAEAAFNPYCGSDGNTYFSPCHGGCLEIRDNETYTECSCLAGFTSPSTSDTDTSNEVPPSLTRGMCPFSCSSLVAFIVVNVLWTASMGTVTAPRTVVILSSVNPTDRSFSIGLSRVFGMLLGSLPFPFLYGTLVDSTCLVWQTLCGQRGFCDIYDIETFRILFWGLSSGLMFVQAMSFLLILFIKRGKWETPQ